MSGMSRINQDLLIRKGFFWQCRWYSYERSVASKRACASSATVRMRWTEISKGNKAFRACNARDGLSFKIGCELSKCTYKIGRASCRERVHILDGAESKIK